MGAQTALNVEDNEVEAWVVRAIGKKLLEARIDQLAGRITIIKSVQRTFSRSQWGQLRAQLAAWKVVPYPPPYFPFDCLEGCLPVPPNPLGLYILEVCMVHRCVSSLHLFLVILCLPPVFRSLLKFACGTSQEGWGRDQGREGGK